MVDSLKNTEVKIDNTDIDIRYTRGTGKGGQHKNKVETCVILTHRPTNISVRIDGRVRTKNEKEARKVLEERIQKHSDKLFSSNYDKIRQDQIGLGFRGEKRRTYRVKDDLVIDHITNKKISLIELYKGKLNKLHN